MNVHVIRRNNASIRCYHSTPDCSRLRSAETHAGRRRHRPIPLETARIMGLVPCIHCHGATT